ncbi:MAG TPA: hypothetical protein VEU30_02230 [Thermoanaerobaculia bacterium]|nr:hypothetical protein [Thermoanaerobaculia bacterium]
MNDSPHVAPLSVEVAIRTSYEYVPLPLFWSQWAKSVPFASSTIDGKSAQFTKRSFRSTIVRGADHCPLR